MIERELSVGSLDNELLLDLLQMTDAAGVLSIYVDAATASIGVHGLSIRRFSRSRMRRVR